MYQKLQGIIIRRRRQELNWSQTTLCAGICAVSHLSKIEQGKAEGSPEVLRLLLQRLGVEWRDDPDFCLEASRQVIFVAVVSSYPTSKSEAEKLWFAVGVTSGSVLSAPVGAAQPVRQLMAHITAARAASFPIY